MPASFDVHDVEELLALMEQWGIAEMRLTVDGAALDLVRATAAGTPVEVATPVAVHAAAPAVAMHEEPIAECLTVTIHSPAVGIFHIAHSGFPHGEPQVGDAVQAGQIIGTIELMRIPNEIASPVSGIIVELPVHDGAGVEFGQPLMVIQPFEEVSEHEAGMVSPPPR